MIRWTNPNLLEDHPPCTWCQRPSTDLVVELDEQVPACEDCTWAHENEPSDEDAHDHYGDVCDRNARLMTTYNR